MVMNRIALYHLETLLWIDRLGTFGAAASRLNTSQPAISARMRELENHLGTALFTRQGRNMILSVRARELVRQCEQIWPLLQTALMEPTDHKSASGIIRIGSGEIAAASCLPGFVNDLNHIMPDLSLEIQIDLTSRLIDCLLNGTSDMVFAIGPIQMPGIKTRKIGNVELIWLSSPETAQKINHDESQMNFVKFWSLMQDSPMHSLQRESIKKLGINNNNINTCNDIHSLIDIVSSGIGISLFPKNMVIEKISSGDLVRVFSQSPPDISLEVAIRSTEIDPIVLKIFAEMRAPQIDHAGTFTSKRGATRARSA